MYDHKMHNRYTGYSVKSADQVFRGLEINSSAGRGKNILYEFYHINMLDGLITIEA